MIKDIFKWILWGVLGYHLFALGLSFYSFNIEVGGTSLYRFDTLIKLLFTICWAAVMAKKIAGFYGYFVLCLFELSIRSFCQPSTFKDVFSNILFPEDLLFIFILLIMYRDHFGTDEQ